MAEASACASSSSVIVNDSPTAEPVTTLRLKLRQPKLKKKVVWTSDTVDNEHMNKKKSKCCCIYEKPHQFGESSSDTDDECEHCHGHVEVKKSNSDQNEAPTPSAATDRAYRRVICR